MDNSYYDIFTFFVDNLVIIFGQKAFRLMSIVKQGAGAIKLHYESEVVELADWILDVKMLQWTDCNNYHLALITTHNVLVRYRVFNKTAKCTYSHSEVSCILYPNVNDKDSVYNM